MTDLHTHILPGIDDGSKNVQTSLALLRSEYAQGVEQIALTPHFNFENQTIKEFLQRRNAAARQLWLSLIHIYVTCMCLLSNIFTEYDCSPGDPVLVRITHYDYTNKHVYGRIVLKL